MKCFNHDARCHDYARLLLLLLIVVQTYLGSDSVPYNRKNFFTRISRFSLVKNKFVQVGGSHPAQSGPSGTTARWRHCHRPSARHPHCSSTVCVHCKVSLFALWALHAHRPPSSTLCNPIAPQRNYSMTTHLLSRMSFDIA